MGFYLGSELDRGLTEELGPTITLGEYASTFFWVIRIFGTGPEQHWARYRPGCQYLSAGLPGRAVGFFSELVARQPRDQPAHRLLGMAHLCQGNLTVGAKHLGITLELLRHELDGGTTFDNALRIHYEAALLRVALIPLYMRLGRTHEARLLVTEAFKTL